MVGIKSSLTSLIATIVTFTPALADEGRQYPLMHMWEGGGHMWNGGWHGWLFGPLMMVLFLAMIVLVVVVIVRWLGGHGHREAYSLYGRPPIEILRERFARGEIDAQEYEERRKVLEGS